MSRQDLRYKLMIALEKSFKRASEADEFLVIYAKTKNLDSIPDRKCEQLLRKLDSGLYKIKNLVRPYTKKKKKKEEKIEVPKPKTGTVSTNGHKTVMRWAKEFDFRGLDVIFVGEEYFVLGEGDFGRARDVAFRSAKHLRDSLVDNRIYAILRRAPCSWTLCPDGIMATICQRHPGSGLKKGYTWHPVPPGPIQENKGWDPYEGCWVLLSTQKRESQTG